MWEVIKEPWPWYIVGPLISVVMFLLLWFGKSFGVSSNLETMCSIAGAGKLTRYFRFDWKKRIWNLVFIAGSILGGFLADQYLSSSSEVPISDNTKLELMAYGDPAPGASMIPADLSTFDALTTPKGLIMLIVGGIFVGFGTRYAGGCTSGHAISGLSNLQPSSLVAVIGFFGGGLLATYFVLPHILTL